MLQQLEVFRSLLLIYAVSDYLRYKHIPETCVSSSELKNFKFFSAAFEWYTNCALLEKRARDGNILNSVLHDNYSTTSIPEILHPSV